MSFIVAHEHRHDRRGIDLSREDDIAPEADMFQIVGVVGLLDAREQIAAPASPRGQSYPRAVGEDSLAMSLQTLNDSSGT